MAISFGDAALAFAGGAANEYNTEVRKQRDSDRKMMERAQEMAMEQNRRIAETKFAKEYEQQLEYKKNQNTLKALSAVGDTRVQNYHIAKNIYKMDEDMALAIANSDAPLKYEVPENLDPERHLRDLQAQLVSQVKDPKVRKRMEEMIGIAESRRYSETIGIDPEAEAMIKRDGVYKSSKFDALFAPKREKVEPFTLKEGEARFGTDAEGNIIELASIPKTPSEKEYTPVESSTYYRNNQTGETIRPVRQGTQYFHGETPIDIREYTPVTDEDETRRAERVSKSVEGLKARQTALGNLEAGLTAYKQTLTEGTTGATGVAIDVGSALGATITGVGELLGVDPVTPEEREKLFMEAGVDIEDFISGDMAALRGMNVGQAKQLVYSLAGILKEDGDLARTSVADVQNAASMIKDLSSTDRGVGALRALDYTLQTKKASVFQQTYQAQGVDPRTRTQAGINLLRTTLLKDPSMFEKAKKQIMVDPTTGEMSMLYADGTTRTLDQIIMSEGVSGQLRPTLGVRADYNR